jgi:phenylpropionate dioxygenase-like ring-hydroxylating dioxygenase large terminal subunit
MRQTSIRGRISRRYGIGARRVANEPATTPPIPRLPVGHPHLGLRDRWYIVCALNDAPTDEPRAVRLLGEDLVLWRSGDDTLVLMADHCPHRGARLSLGDVVNGELRCWYHGWQFNTEGQCTSIPSQGGKCSLQARVSIDSRYPVRERAGYVWAWIGEGEPGPLTLPSEMEDSTFSAFGESVMWDANWLLVLENIADLLHAPYLHARSLTLSRGVTEDRIRVADESFGFRVERAGQQGVNFDWVEISTGPVLWARLDIPYPNKWAAGPGPALRINALVTPIDETRTWVHVPRLRQVAGWHRWLWRTLYRLRLRGTHLHVLNQDKAMLESIRSVEEGYRDEHLAQSDKGVAHLRKVLTPAMEAQLRAVEGPDAGPWIGRRRRSATDTAGDSVDDEQDARDEAMDVPSPARAAQP